MTGKQITTLVIGVIVAGAIGYDVFAYLHWGSEASISQIIYHAAYTPPGGAIIPLLFGILMGHLFFNQ